MKVATKITLPVKILNGGFASNQHMISNIMDAYEGHTIDVTFQKRTNKRSMRQNKYYWAVIIPIFQNCIMEEWVEIWSIEKTHEYLKMECNYSEKVNEASGLITRVPRSTTENSTTEAENYYTKCRALALEFFNTEIPLPNEDLELKF